MKFVAFFNHSLCFYKVQHHSLMCSIRTITETVPPPAVSVSDLLIHPHTFHPLCQLKGNANKFSFTSRSTSRAHRISSSSAPSGPFCFLLQKAVAGLGGVISISRSTFPSQDLPPNSARICPLWVPLVCHGKS